MGLSQYVAVIIKWRTEISRKNSYAAAAVAHALLRAGSRLRPPEVTGHFRTNVETAWAIVGQDCILQAGFSTGLLLLSSPAYQF